MKSTDSMIDFFKIAMARQIEPLLPRPKVGLSLNLGAGKKMIPGSIALDLPQWNALFDPIPYVAESVSEIWALHFLEHFENPIKILQECQRVLKPGGVMNICVPNFSSQIAFQDIDHKRYYTIETWKTLFHNTFYDKNKIEWKFKIGFNIICGIAERNMVILTQLIKE